MFADVKMISTRLLPMTSYMSDVNFQNNNSLNNFLSITKTTQYGDVEATQMVILT